MARVKAAKVCIVKPNAKDEQRHRTIALVTRGDISGTLFMARPLKRMLGLGSNQWQQARIF